MGTEAKRPRRCTSSVWEFFERKEDGKSAKCKLCPDTVIKTPNSATSSLSRHLSKIHPSVRISEDIPNEGIQKDVVKEPFELREMISRLAAEDGIPFATIAKSHALRRLTGQNSGDNLPHSPNTVREVVLRFYEDKKSVLMTSMGEIIHSGAKLSLTLDEWSSCAKKRYMNVNVHSKNGTIFNLGLVRITGSFNSQNCLDLLNGRLSEFNLSLEKDIVGVVTDGASVMKKFGRMSNRKHQLCISHGIHLAVMEVLYKKNATDLTTDEEHVEQDEDAEDHFTSGLEILEIEDVTELNADYSTAINKVRKIVKSFQSSPLKCDLLRKYTKASHKQELTIDLDCRTRWNSLTEMLERFSLIKDEIKKVYSELQVTFAMSEEEVRDIETIVSALLPVKVAVEAICQRNATLYTCDVALDFMMKNVKSCASSHFGLNMYNALATRITERRTSISEVCYYLHFGLTHSHRSDPREKCFKRLSQAQMIETIKSLYLLCQDSRDSQPSSSCSQEETAPSTLANNDNLKAELNQLINDARNSSSRYQSSNSKTSLESVVKKEIALYEISGSRGGILNAVYNMLLTIPPSSVESERAFSCANYFCTKIRSRLSDRSLNALVVLKSYFKNG